METLFIIYNGELPPAFTLVYSYAIQRLPQKKNKHSNA